MKTLKGKFYLTLRIIYFYKSLFLFFRVFFSFFWGKFLLEFWKLKWVNLKLDIWVYNLTNNKIVIIYKLKYFIIYVLFVCQLKSSCVFDKNKKGVSCMMQSNLYKNTIAIDSSI